MAGAVVFRIGTLRAGLAGGRRAAFLAPSWGVGGASVLCAGPAAVAQRALFWAFMFVLMSFLYFRCILAFLYLCACVLPYMA